MIINPENIKDKQGKLHIKKAVTSCLSFFLVFSLLACLSGCSKINFSTFFGSRDENGNDSILQTNQTSIADEFDIDETAFILPDIPESLSGEELPALIEFELLPYIVLVDVPQSKDVAKIWKEKSMLLKLQKQLPSGQLALDKRIQNDEAEAKKILQAFGYYSGTVHTDVDFGMLPVMIKVNIDTKEQYTVGKADIVYPLKVREEHAQGKANILPDNAPDTLFDFDLEENTPALSSSLFSAMGEIEDWFQRRGFPFAKIDGTKHYAYTDTLKLDTQVFVNPHEYTRFGSIVLEGTESVRYKYINKLKSWKEGDRWNARRVNDLQEELINLGLFSYVETNIADTVHDENMRDIVIKVQDAPQRTWGGGLNYDTERGFGGQLFWEHRNLLGEAETLRTEGVLWMDTQEWITKFRKPDLFKRNQDFTANAVFLKEKTESYNTSAFTLALGIEQPLEKQGWRLSYYLAGEAGYEQDTVMSGSQFYYYAGLPVQLSYRNTRSIFDPSSGMRISFKLAPYAGKYKKDFSLVWSELNFNTFYELMADKKLILALKVRLGSLYPAKAEDIPASLRFYVGGGGSVRGYAYQSIGPQNADNKPMGGASFVEASLELRYKINKDIAIVPFIDAGNVYSSPYPDKNLDLRFGAGIGVRYFTPVGPVRVDVAVPLNPVNKANKNGFQLYVSIGQSF